MVRTPCCKAELGLKKGAWTPKEDQKLVSYVSLHGEGGWRTLPERAGLKRCGKSCRLRWANYLRPNIKRGDFKEDEERSIISLHALHGNKWAAIARELPGRTDNEIKNYWNTRIKKHLIKKGIDPVTHKGLIISDTEKSKNLLEKQKSYNDDDDIDKDKAKYSNKKSPSAKFLNRVANVFGKTNNTSVMSEIINRSGGPLITTSQTITTTTTTNTSVTVDSESDKSTSSPFTPISNLLYSSTSSDSSLPLMYCEDHHEDNVGFSSFLSDEDFMMLEESCVGNNHEFMRKRARFDATSFYENQDVFQEIDNFLHERNF